jgi:hypothetical protein
LSTISGDGTDDGVLLALETVHTALGPVLGASGIVLGLASSMLLAARLLPFGRAGQVTDGLDYATLDRVVLTGGLAAIASLALRQTTDKREKTHLGSALLLLKDMAGNKVCVCC